MLSLPTSTKAERAIPKLPAAVDYHRTTSARRRREPVTRATNVATLLLRFLPYAAYVDIELRSLRGFRQVLEAAQSSQIPVIISFTTFRTHSSQNQLRVKERAALAAGAGIFKVASRTDSAAQLARLLAFFTGERHALPVSAMGTGNSGALRGSRSHDADRFSTTRTSARRESQDNWICRRSESRSKVVAFAGKII